ncbi:hypothetical protein QBC35DRAFT_455680 [Podospora australis]|uniref:Nascent polypeptide-associated complex subunit alpha-like UBA domain-containing protein n=1 Tax=Podospora australis TaxID=1536484 RepID=A0AAN6WLX9_9PEZI|nr:hypothetical protein QBC35DRAFT_455680 [Podospora australis]
MAEDRQPPNIVEGANPPADIDDEPEATTAKSAEDRKAAAALSNLDDNNNADNDSGNNVDSAAAQNALNSLGGKAPAAAAAAAKKVKVDLADVKLLEAELNLSKAKATELLKAHDGDAVTAMKAYIQPSF